MISLPTQQKTSPQNFHFHIYPPKKQERQDSIHKEEEPHISSDCCLFLLLMLRRRRWWRWRRSVVCGGMEQQRSEGHGAKAGDGEEGGGEEAGVGGGRGEGAEVEEMGAEGEVPEPVAAMMEGSAWRRSHSMVSPSDRWPSSRVSWKIRAAHIAGMRTRRPRPFTFVWRSLVEDLVRWLWTAIWVDCAVDGGGGELCRRTNSDPI
ncbi:hypothetical protein Scep_005056 [Stephania cephalantha]|uniref:Uncharacterized protein n=1 Tax=Stephania cephalantha TaxID=152367 RepID=A0AAP0PVZ8_9MAGN